MSRAALSSIVFGVYACSMGLSLLLVPDLVLTVLGLPLTDEIWIRVLGIVAAALGSYYIQAGRHELVPFFRASIFGRLFFVVGVAICAVLWSFPVLFVFVGIEAAAACWTALALRQGANVPHG